MSIRLLCFKVHKVNRPFKMNERLNPFSQPSFQVDWSSQNSYELSTSLNNQVRNNYMELEALRVSCNEPSDVPMFTVRTYGNQVGVPEYPMTLEQKSKACKIFLERSRDYDEVISRDQDALNYDEIDVEQYAVVILRDNIYQGHIYAWLSNIDPSYCFAMGSE